MWKSAYNSCGLRRGRDRRRDPRDVRRGQGLARAGAPLGTEAVERGDDGIWGLALVNAGARGPPRTAASQACSLPTRPNLYRPAFSPRAAFYWHAFAETLHGHGLVELGDGTPACGGRTSGSGRRGSSSGMKPCPLRGSRHADPRHDAVGSSLHHQVAGQPWAR